MKSVFPFRHKVAAASLSVSVILAVSSLLVLNSMNINLVHSTLYSYGLTFSPQWAHPYWQTLNAAFTAITATAVFAVLAIVTLAAAKKTGSNKIQRWSAVFSILTLTASVGSLALFVLLAGYVNGELYSYGLQFSSGWFKVFQLYFAGYVAMQAATAALNAVSFSLVHFGSKQPIKKISLQKIFFPTLTALGGILIALSFFYQAATAFFAGFILVFWGSIMLFISGTRLVRKDVLDATCITYWSQIDKIITDQDRDNMVYTAGCFNKIQASCLPIQQLQPVELTFGKPEHVNLAPENELFNLLERTLGKSFSGLSFAKFQEVLPKLLVESLELAQNVTVEANGETVKVTVENPYDLQVYLKNKNHNHVIDAVGFPLSGAIAYALASSSGKPVIINRHVISLNKKSVEFDYTLLGQRSAAT